MFFLPPDDFTVIETFVLTNQGLDKSAMQLLSQHDVLSHHNRDRIPSPRGLLSRDRTALHEAYKDPERHTLP